MKLKPAYSQKYMEWVDSVIQYEQRRINRRIKQEKIQRKEIPERLLIQMVLMRVV